MTEKKLSDRIYRTLRRPIETEKSTRVADLSCRQIVFEVLPEATKQDIKQAVESFFSVTVLRVQTLNVRGKTRRFRQIPGRTKAWKKAYVTLAEGHDIQLSDLKVG